MHTAHRRSSPGGKVVDGSATTTKATKQDEHHKVANCFVIYAHAAIASREVIEEQTAFCRAYGRGLGLKEVGLFADNGRRSRLSTRPALEELLVKAEMRTFGIVIVNDLDRLARDALVVDGIIDKLKRHGVSVRTVLEGPIHSLTPDGFSRRLVQRVFAEAAEGHNSARIARRLSDKKISPEKLIRWEDARAIRERYEQRGYTNVVVSIKAVDKDGLVHIWRDPELV